MLSAYCFIAMYVLYSSSSSLKVVFVLYAYGQFNSFSFISCIYLLTVRCCVCQHSIKALLTDLHTHCKQVQPESKTRVCSRILQCHVHILGSERSLAHGFKDSLPSELLMQFYNSSQVTFGRYHLNKNDILSQ